MTDKLARAEYNRAFTKFIAASSGPEPAMGDFETFLKGLGVHPRELSYYRKALTHVSCAPNPDESYERLEFLGDSIIGMVVADCLFRTFPEKEEGELTRLKSVIVSRETLGGLARELGLEKYLRVKTARVKQGNRAEDSILGDAFEALVGAIFADRGYREARSFVLRFLKNLCRELGKRPKPIDFKSRLQELFQERYKEPPVYAVVSESGPAHDKLFTVEVRYRRKKLGRGKGTSKKRAEQEAAKAALERIAAQDAS